MAASDLGGGRLFAIWSWFSLLGIITLLVIFAAPLSALLEGQSDATSRWIWLALPALLWLVVAAAGTALSRTQGGRGGPLKAIERYTSLLSWLLLFGILGPIARMILHFIPGGNDTAVAGFLDAAFSPAWDSLSRALDLGGLPQTMAGVPSAPLILFLLLLFVRNAIHWRVDRLRMQLYRDTPTLPPQPRTEEESEEARARLRAIERRLAVASYTEAKTLLQSTQLELTFLSLDVVGSTTMKQGEDPYLVEQSFADYRKLVEAALRKHGAYKQTWTPDGQMAAFKHAQAAVDCARDILSELGTFNRTRSKLRRPFRLRAGANLGMVSTDDATPMEQISDFSIDVAGHLQKYAEPDMLWVSEDLYERLSDPAGFAATGKEVDGRRVFAWKKEE